MKKTILVVVAIVVASGFMIGYGMLKGAHRNIAEEKTAYELNSAGIIQMFNNGHSDKLMNQPLEIQGVVTQLETEYILLDDQVQCTLMSPGISLKIGDSITVKGRCIGYDDLFEIVKLDQCTLISFKP